MKYLIYVMSLLFLISCGNGGESSQDKPSQDKPSQDKPSQDKPSQKNINKEYNVACKCKNLQPLNLNASSTVSEVHAKLIAGSVCVALQSENIQKTPENMLSEAEKARVQQIIQQTVDNAWLQTPDQSVLNSIYDCS